MPMIICLYDLTEETIICKTTFCLYEQ